MTTKLEQIARALFAKHNFGSDWDDGFKNAEQRDQYLDISDLTHECSFALARTAIQALMEPSEGMVKAGAAPIGWMDRRFDSSKGVAGEVFEAMLTAILEETD